MEPFWSVTSGRGLIVASRWLAAYLFKRERLGFRVFPEQRIQVAGTRFRVPDICATRDDPEEQIFTTPPFICVEILSRSDRMSEMQERIDDYLSFGVPNVWVLDPRTQRAYLYTREGSREVKDALRTQNPDIMIPLEEVFAESK
jgi:Uma2 family endonuclease